MAQRTRRTLIQRIAAALKTAANAPAALAAAAGLKPASNSPWDVAVAFVEALAKQAVRVVRRVIKFVWDHPIRTASIIVGIIMTVAPQFVAGAAMAAVGFGAAGPVAGSAAAAMQSSIGSVAAGSAFSIVQSTAMGGPGAAVVSGVVRIAGLVVAGAAALWGYLWA